jgi:glycosyltransferase involved in cell wall biosynthesis
VTADKLATVGPPRESIRVVPNGIDAERIRSTTPADDGFDVLFAGRLIADKNVDTLLTAFDRVANADTTLGIVGDGPERDRLERQAAHLDSADRITFLGFLDEYDDVLAQMRAASVFASPSTREGFGITFVEAMAADCVVVAADHPDSAASEVVGDGGCLVSPTVDDVATGLSSAIGGSRPPRPPTDVAAGYDWDAVTREAERVYTDVATDSEGW